MTLMCVGLVEGNGCRNLQARWKHFRLRHFNAYRSAVPMGNLLLILADYFHIKTSGLFIKILGMFENHLSCPSFFNQMFSYVYFPFRFFSCHSLKDSSSLHLYYRQYHLFVTRVAAGKAIHLHPKPTLLLFLVEAIHLNLKPDTVFRTTATPSLFITSRTYLS